MGIRRGLVAAGVLTIGAGGMLLGVTAARAQVAPIRIDLIPDGMVVLDGDHDGRIETGDRSAGRLRPEDPTTGDRVGRAFFECTAMTRVNVQQQRGTWLCTLVLALPDGHLTMQGEDLAGDGPYVWAVTGGTGPYRTARGEATGVDVSDGTVVRSEMTINLEP